MDSDNALMSTIRRDWAAQLAAAVHASSLPESFLAAIVANESGGHAAVSRFEPAVFTRLVNVAAGRQAAFSCPGSRKPLTAPDLLAYASPGELQPSQVVAEYQGPPFQPAPPGAPARGLQWGLKRLSDLATSFGLCQVMGWHLVEMAGYAGWAWTVGDLLDGAKNLQCAVALASYFAVRYELDLSKDFEQLLRCWNCGTPDGTTFDPMYVPNGLARSAAYAALSISPAAPPAA